jgi:hypothetical protein
MKSRMQSEQNVTVLQNKFSAALISLFWSVWNKNLRIQESIGITGYGCIIGLRLNFMKTLNW